MTDSITVFPRWRGVLLPRLFPPLQSNLVVYCQSRRSQVSRLYYAKFVVSKITIMRWSYVVNDGIWWQLEAKILILVRVRFCVLSYVTVVNLREMASSVSASEINGPIWSVASVVLFSATHLLLRPLTPTSVLKSGYQTTWKWRNILNSLIHSALTGIWAMLRYVTYYITVVFWRLKCFAFTFSFRYTLFHYLFIFF